MAEATTDLDLRGPHGDGVEERGTTGRSAGRLAGVAAAVGRLRGFSVHTALVVASSIMVPAGIVAILLGWYGASRTPFLFEQIPYVISGGLLGIGLLVGGGLLYLASWVARLAAQQHEDAEQLRRLLESRPSAAIVAPATAVAQAPEAADTTPPDTGGAGPAVAGLVATPTGTMFHRPDCQVVSGRDDLRPASADDPKLHPCKLCDPLAG